MLLKNEHLNRKMLSLPLKLTLYSLGQCYRQLNRRFDNAPLEVAISKVVFIETLLRAMEKKERALYRNLELLQKKKLISYTNKELRFTERGYKHFLNIQKKIEPFIRHQQFWSSHLPDNKGLQSKLKR